MVTNVLIASPTTAFGELIRLTLEGEGSYHATCVSSGSEVVFACQSSSFALIILDADLDDLPLADLWLAIHKLQPDIRSILVPPNNDIQSPTIADFSPNGYLSKPFYLPDLLNIVRRALPRPEVPPSAGSTGESSQEAITPGSQPAQPDRPVPAKPASRPLVPTAPAWLQDVTRAAQHLTRLSLETAALAALIIRDSDLWAYAGELSQPAAHELAETVAHYWERGNGSDLARFVHLNATDGDYMLYATAVSADMALAMVFDIEMPFSKIRAQASSLARSLASPPGIVPVKAEPKIVPPASPTYSADEALEEDESLDLANLVPLFDDVPPAMPSGQPVAAASEMRKPPVQATSADRPQSERREKPDLRSAYEAQSPEKQPQPESTPEPAPEEAMPGKLEPASAAICNLNYACMLLPRMPKHILEGDLAQSLTTWVPQLCLAYGWRLEQILIQPDYVSWVIDVPPNVSPGTVMRIFRQRTSARIFAHFPIMEQDNPSKDFWAPGYLIMSSGQLPPEALVKDFIKQTRQRQGVIRLADPQIHG